MNATAQSSNHLVIDTHGLSKTYNHGRIQALKGLNLQVARHSIFGFLGPNGAGKSTAIKLLLGLVRPTAGTATIFDRTPSATAQPSVSASDTWPRIPATTRI